MLLDLEMSTQPNLVLADLSLNMLQEKKLQEDWDAMQAMHMRYSDDYFVSYQKICARDTLQKPLARMRVHISLIRKRPFAT